MANSRTPPPPLPFGSPGQYKETLANQQARGIKPVTPDTMEGVRDVRDLLGSAIYSELALRGEIGTPPATQQINGDMMRQPFVLTCQEWLEKQRYLIAAVNPSEVQWRLPQRAAAQKTRGGEIVHYWRDRFRGTYYDEPQLTITFQSGNIMPIRERPPVKTYAAETLGTIANVGVRYKTDASETTPKVPQGLRNFYEFLELVDTQKILDSGDVNLVYIIYNSRQFPNMTLSGLFTPEGVGWSDSSSDPNQVSSWSANFTVYDSFPRLNEAAAMIKMFEQAGWGRIG